MAGKYEDLLQNMKEDFLIHEHEASAVKAALQWLDENPELAPGRTITESEFNWRTSLCSELEAYWFKVGYFAAGGNIVPDPEPTNAEKLDKIMEEWPGRATASDPTFGEYLHNRGVRAPEGGNQ